MSEISYLKGVFIVEKSGPYGPFLSISITEEGLKALEKLPKSPKGYINLTASRQREDQSKFSVKPYAPKAPINNDKDSNDSTDKLPWD